jgi:hypothetical protein
MRGDLKPQERKMRTVFLALATSAAIFATGLTPAGAQNYPYCIQGDDFPGGAGDCSFSSYAQCQATASGRTAYCEPNRYFNYLNAKAHLVYRGHVRHRSH